MTEKKKKYWFEIQETKKYIETTEEQVRTAALNLGAWEARRDMHRNILKALEDKK